MSGTKYDFELEPKPDLAEFAKFLRTPGRWPEWFEWNYRYCQTCALELAHQLYPNHIPTGTVQIVMDAFALRYWDAFKIFVAVMPEHIIQANQVTANDVADAIDEYLKDPQQ